MDRACRLLKELIGTRPLVWMGSGSYYLQPTLAACAVRAQLFCAEPNHVEPGGPEYIAIEDGLSERPDWNEFAETDIFHRHGKSFRMILSGLDRPLVLPYWVTTPLQALIDEFHGEVIGNSGCTVDHLDHREVGRDFVERCGLEILHPEIYQLSSVPSYAALSTSLGCRAPVISAPGSVGGAWVRQVTDQASLDKAVRRIDKAFPGEYLEAAPFIEGLPLNLNIAIMPKENDRDCAVVLYPVSAQIIGVQGLSDEAFRYCGCDFPTAAGTISPELAESLYAAALAIGRKLFQKFNWKGFFGIDVILTPDGRLIFVELNPRLQSSTHLLDLHFRDEWNPILLQAAAFLSKGFVACDTNLQNRSPDLSFLISYNDSEKTLTLKNLMAIKPDTYGFPALGKTVAPGGILFRRLFHKPVLNPTSKVLLEPIRREMTSQQGFSYGSRIPLMGDNEFSSQVWLKAQLLAGGVCLDTPAPARPFYSVVTEGIDLCFASGATVNAPVRDDAEAKLTGNGDEYYIRLGRQRHAVQVFPVTPSLDDPIGETGETVSDYCSISTDRANIWAVENCVLGLGQTACRFCDVAYGGNGYTRKDLKIISAALERLLADHSKYARHIQVTGGTPKGGDWEHYLAVCKIAISKGIPVSVMTSPWTPFWVLERMKEIGIGELSLNIEFASRHNRELFSPGKSGHNIWKRLEMVTATWSQMTVRSAILVGLDSLEELRESVKYLLDIGILPVLSPFRPAHGTPMENCAAPSAESLYAAFMETADLAVDAGMFVGPSCNACQHNVMAMPIGLYTTNFTGIDFHLLEEKSFGTLTQVGSR